MKPNFVTRTTASFTLFALCLAVAPTLRSQIPAPGQPGYQAVEMLTPQTQAFAIGRLAGKPVRGANQQELGRIADFLIDPRTGQVHQAIVDVGWNVFRIVPMSAFQGGSGAEGIVLALDRARWDQIITLTDQQLLGRVNLDAAHQQRFQQQFQLPAADAPAEGLIRATYLNQRELRVGTEAVGTVEDVVIDFHNRISAPLVKMKAGAGGSEQHVLVHFAALQVGPEFRSPIVANLGRNDFRQMRSPQQTPTGYTGIFNAQGEQRARSAAMRVQQALERDAGVPPGAVQVLPETRIVLRGAVDSEQKRAEVERTAQQAAPGVRVENQLMVRNR
jgi:sporulation protein YlmC with PRC-barrel domain